MSVSTQLELIMKHIIGCVFRGALYLSRISEIFFMQMTFGNGISNDRLVTAHITKTSVILSFQSYYINIKFSQYASGIRNMSWCPSRKYGIFIGYHAFSCVGWNLYFCDLGWISSILMNIRNICVDTPLKAKFGPIWI